MSEKILCTICEKEMKEEDLGWNWGEEDAHKECVLKTANKICSEDCGYFSVQDDDEPCGDCGAEVRDITEKDRNRRRSK